MSITKRHAAYIEEQKKIQSLKLNYHKNSLNKKGDKSVEFSPLGVVHDLDAMEIVDDVVTLPAWNTMSDDDKIDEAKRLCAAVEEKLGIRPPKIAEKMAERLHIGSTTYGNYRRGLCVLSSQRQRRGSYSIVREILAVYLNTGDVADLQLPKDQREKDAAAVEERLTGIEKRLAVAEKANSENAMLNKRIDFVDKACNSSLGRHHEIIIALQQRLDGLAKANKLLLEKLEATTEPTPDATPWWKRWSR